MRNLLLLRKANVKTVMKEKLIKMGRFFNDKMKR